MYSIKPVVLMVNLALSLMSVLLVLARFLDGVNSDQSFSSKLQMFRSLQEFYSPGRVSRWSTGYDSTARQAKRCLRRLA